MEMDPPSLINEPYSDPNAAPYNLAEIWQFQMNGDAAISESGLGERRAQFVPNLGQMGEASTGNRDLSANAPPRKAQNGTIKRRSTEEDSPTGLPVGNGVAANDNKKRHKTGGNRKMNSESKTGGELQNSQTPKQDYIHVRARRGQATDSHSLAERARREKISERMKILQDLVPGCDKVIGKALVLDEIINYIQSLQCQVEFLSKKIEAFDSRMSPGIEVFPTKDFGDQTFESKGVAFGSHAAREFRFGPAPQWLHMQVGGAFERTTQPTKFGLNSNKSTRN